MSKGQFDRCITATGKVFPCSNGLSSHPVAIGAAGFISITNDRGIGAGETLGGPQMPIRPRPGPHKPGPFAGRSSWQLQPHQNAATLTLGKNTDRNCLAPVVAFLPAQLSVGHPQDWHGAAGGVDVLSFPSMRFGAYGLVKVADAPILSQVTSRFRYHAFPRAEERPPSIAIKSMVHRPIEVSTMRNKRLRHSDFLTLDLHRTDRSCRACRDVGPNDKDRDRDRNRFHGVSLALVNNPALRSAVSPPACIERRNNNGARDLQFRPRRAGTEARHLSRALLADKMLGELPGPAPANRSACNRVLHDRKTMLPAVKSLGVSPAQT